MPRVGDVALGGPDPGTGEVLLLDHPTAVLGLARLVPVGLPVDLQGFLECRVPRTEPLARSVRVGRLGRAYGICVDGRVVVELALDECGADAAEVVQRVPGLVGDTVAERGELLRREVAALHGGPVQGDLPGLEVELGADVRPKIAQFDRHRVRSRRPERAVRDGLQTCPAFGGQQVRPLR